MVGVIATVGDDRSPESARGKIGDMSDPIAQKATVISPRAKGTRLVPGWHFNYLFDSHRILHFHFSVLLFDSGGSGRFPRILASQSSGYFEIGPFPSICNGVPRHARSINSLYRGSRRNSISRISRLACPSENRRCPPPVSSHFAPTSATMFRTCLREVPVAAAMSPVV